MLLLRFKAIQLLRDEQLRMTPETKQTVLLRVLMHILRIGIFSFGPQTLSDGT